MMVMKKMMSYMTMCIIIGVIVMMIMIDESIASTIKKQQIINKQ